MTSSVREYYDLNTKRFLRFGAGGKVGAIHRKLWGPGVQTREGALLFINKWVVRQLQKNKPEATSSARYLDLGCGVGGTALFVAKSIVAHVRGITLSAKQAQIARERANENDLKDRCSFIVADFEAHPTTQNFDAAFAIESFAHSSNPEKFFQQISERLHPGGLLLLVEDMLAEHLDENATGPTTWLRRFKQGWRLNAVMKPSRIHALAQDAGFRLKSAHNFTAYIQTGSGILRNVFKWLTRLPLPGAYWQSLSGGLALDVCISRGWVLYQGLIFEKA